MNTYAYSNAVSGLILAILSAAEESVRAAIVEQKKRSNRPRKPYVSLRPGPTTTPVWNQLVRSAAPFFRRRGDKVKLARLLGISRQRLHQLLVARTACADAERTLLLLAWVTARRAGRNWT